MAKTYVLILGDTHAVGNWGTELEARVRALGTKRDPIVVTRVGVEGAGAYHYNRGTQKQLPGKKKGSFSDAISKQYALAFVLLGTEDAAQLSQREAAREILALFTKVKATNKFLILPPPYSKEFSESYKVSPDDVRQGKDLNWQVDKVGVYLYPIIGGMGYRPMSDTSIQVNQSATNMDLTTNAAKIFADAVLAAMSSEFAQTPSDFSRELAPESEVEPAPVEEPPQQEQEQQEQQSSDSQETLDLPADTPNKEAEKKEGSKVPYIVAGVGLALLIGAAVVRARKGKA